MTLLKDWIITGSYEAAHRTQAMKSKIELQEKLIEVLEDLTVEEIAEILEKRK